MERNDFQRVSSANICAKILNIDCVDRDNTYGMDKNVPIPMDTVLTVNQTGHTINSWGKGLFFLPHMITVDSQVRLLMTQHDLT